MALKPYHELTRSGRFRRMRPIAVKALSHYPITVRSLQAMHDFTNMNFKVTTNQGKKFVLRLCSPGWRTAENLYSEIDWLLGIHRDTDITAPVPLLTRNKKHFVSVKINTLDPVRCVVLSWLPGTLLAYRLTPANLHKMGQLFANLHQYSLKFTPLDQFSSLTLNSVLARGEQNSLFTAKTMRKMPKVWQKRLEAMRQNVVSAYRKRYRNPIGLRVIHHDLHHENILVHRGQLQPFDFEDTALGFPVQDIAMAMLDLLDDTGPDRYQRLYHEFRNGYESVSQWPESYAGEIHRFQQGRRLWVANWHANYEPAALFEYISRPMFDSIPRVK